jgi:5-hydroxyisourate hydrolase-like protein (transthyretin family)
LKVEAAAIPFIKQNGIIYTTDVPVKKAGNYNFRVAVRDAGSKMIGSAGQTIQIPDLKKSGIFISGLIVSATDANGKFTIPTAVNPENALSPANSVTVPAIRRFRPGTILAYAYRLYNARIDKVLGQPKLTVQVNLYRDGQIIVEGSPQAAQLEKIADQTRIDDYGYMKLNANAEKGDYALQVIVKDLLSKETTSQWIDFEVE